jgi:hypothetical protein
MMADNIMWVHAKEAEVYIHGKMVEMFCLVLPVHYYLLPYCLLFTVHKHIFQHHMCTS